MKHILVILFFLICINLHSQETITYASEVDGSVTIGHEKISIKIRDFPQNVENETYKLINRSDLKYIVIRDKEYLVLRNNTLLYLIDDKNHQIFFGINGSGKFENFIGPAKRYHASTYLIEKDTHYLPKNMAYLLGNHPYVEGATDDGKRGMIELEWNMTVARLVIINGFISFDKPFLFKMNNRLRQIQIVDESGLKYNVSIMDTPEPQIINLLKPSKKLTIEIIETYSGTKYNDTCVALLNGIDEIGELIGNN